MEVALLPSRTSLLVRALVNIVLGAVVMAWPGLTLLVLIFAFAINLLITGVFLVFEPAFDKSNQHAALTVILGVLSAVVGIYLLGRPQLAAGVVTLLIALWALLYGMVDLYVGISARKDVKGFGWLIITGILALIFGIYMLFNPIEGVLALVWVIGLYAVVTGAILGCLAIFAYPSLKGKK